MRKVRAGTMWHPFFDRHRQMFPRSGKPRHQMAAAVTVPPMATVTPPNKRDMIPVIDPRLRNVRISSSKVPPCSKVQPPYIHVLFARGLVMLFPVAGPSPSAPSCIGDATAEQGALYIFHLPRFT